MRRAVKTENKVTASRRKEGKLSYGHRLPTIFPSTALQW